MQKCRGQKTEAAAEAAAAQRHRSRPHSQANWPESACCPVAPVCRPLVCLVMAVFPHSLSLDHRQTITFTLLGTHSRKPPSPPPPPPFSHPYRRSSIPTWPFLQSRPTTYRIVQNGFKLHDPPAVRYSYPHPRPVSSLLHSDSATHLIAHFPWHAVTITYNQQPCHLCGHSTAGSTRSGQVSSSSWQASHLELLSSSSCSSPSACPASGPSTS